SQLFSQLKKLAPNRAQTIDKKNKRRLIRAIEIAQYTRASCACTRCPCIPSHHNVLYLGLTLPNAELKEKIRKRFLAWLRQGLVLETKKLTKQVKPKRLREIGLAYPIVAEYILGKITKNQMIERSINSIYHYAKRQKAWFGRNKKIQWIKKIQEAAQLTNNFFMKIQR
ncbi:MAG: tRNA dimethylallyltransferase, partial [bacterium]|nr:tRNA dimethylallyltransferase [bacterium]